MCVKVMSVKGCWSQCELVCDVKYVWVIVQEYARVLYNTVCVTMSLTLKLALRQRETGYDIVDVKLTAKLG